MFKRAHLSDFVVKLSFVRGVCGDMIHIFQQNRAYESLAVTRHTIEIERGAFSRIYESAKSCGGGIY